MAGFEKIKHIGAELKGHAPFTIFGAVLGIIFMLVFRKVSVVSSHGLFSIFHPAHVVLSAMVTTSMFKLHSFKKNFLTIIIVGYVGSVGIATLSDIVIPHIGTRLLGLDIPSHSDLHSISKETAQAVEQHSDHRMHFGFIEEWYIVNPAAFVGIFIACFLPRTKFPHAAHILVSTWASAAYLLMELHSDLTAGALIGMFVTLFMAVWLPCCFSDIVFPLMFVNSDLVARENCTCHIHHSHRHLPNVTEQKSEQTTSS